MKLRIFIVFIASFLLLTGCSNEVTKEDENTDYPRLPINEEIKNIEIGEDINDFMQLYSYILPGYTIKFVCGDVKSDLWQNRELMENNTIYITNTSNCPIEGTNYNATTSVFKINEINDSTMYNIGMYQIYDKDKEKSYYNDSCYETPYININNKIYVMVLYVVQEDGEVDYFSSAYCPDKDYFENEYLQYSNWIYDSFKQLEK